MRRKLRLLAAAGLLAFSVFGSAAPASAHGTIDFIPDSSACTNSGTAVTNAYPVVIDTGWVWHRSVLWSYARGGWVTWNDGGTNTYWSHWAYGYGPSATPNWGDYNTGNAGVAQTFVGIPFVNSWDTFAVYNEVYFSDGHVAAYWTGWSNWC